MLQDILKEFEERFVHIPPAKKELFQGRIVLPPYEIKGSVAELKDFITKTYNTARKELVEEILREMPKEMKYDNKIGGSGSIGYNLYRHAVIDLLNKKI